MIGGYVLGTDAEAMSFAQGAVVYRPAGTRHAVDLQHPANTRGAAVGYAICGQPIRIWADEAFDPNARDVHPDCVAAASGAARH